MAATITIEVTAYKVVPFFGWARVPVSRMTLARTFPNEATFADVYAWVRERLADRPNSKITKTGIHFHDIENQDPVLRR